MELKDLDHEERVALVALVQFIGESNPELTDEESERIADIVEAFGEEAYRELASEVDESFPDEESLRVYLANVGRPDARGLVYGTALDLATGDTIQPAESELLEWLAEEWGIEVEFAVPDEE